MATTTDIISKNINAWHTAYQICNCKQHPTGTEALTTLEEFEGWGRCRTLIDTNSEDYKTALATIKQHLATHFCNSYRPDDYDFVARNILNEAQSSTLTSFYTPQLVADAITTHAFRAYHQLNGKYAHTVLDPSAGTGRFLNSLPILASDDMPIHVETCEKDTMTREVLKATLKLSQEEWGKGFSYHADSTKYELLHHSAYDIIVSNIPFGSIKVQDKDFAKIGEVYKNSCKLIHAYYFLKAMRQLNDGGILAFITSRGFLSSPGNKPFRDEMLKHGRAIAIVRLPDNLFPTVEVGTDLIVYQNTGKPADMLNRKNRIFSYGWTEDKEDEQLADERGNCIEGIERSIRKNQYGKQVVYYKDTDKATTHTRLQSTLKDCLAMAIAGDKPTTPPTTVPDDSSSGKKHTPMQKPTLAIRPSAKPVLAKPLNDKTTNRVSEPKPLTKPTLAIRPSAKPVLAIAKPKKTDWRLELQALVNMYHTLDDTTRPQFLNLYNTIVQGSHKNLHQLVKDYGTSLPAEFGSILLTLEQKNAEGAWIAADIFHHAVDTVTLGVDNDAQAALAASLNKFGKVDLPFMQATSKLTRDELVANLDKQLFFNPITGSYEEADRFLTGDVVAKAKEARKALDQYRNGDLIEAEHAIAALEAARPAPIPFNDIDAPFGARWIPTSFFEDFLYYTDGTTRQDDTYGKIQLTYSSANDDYMGSAWVRKSDWRMKGYDTEDTIMWALRGATPKFMTENADGKKVPDEEKYQRANNLVNLVKTAWQDFINLPSSAYIRKECERIYNERFNAEVRPTYDGSFQTFPDLHLENLGITDLYPSQKDAIWMLKRNGGGVCWHEVGTGKTLIMCIASYEMKRIGLVNKPLIIGMKANVAQIADTYRKAYPTAKLLFPTNADFHKDRRKELFDQIKNNDWDCIIMSHDQFGQIPAAEITQMKVMQQRIDGLSDVLSSSSGGRFRGRQLSGLQKRKENLAIKLDNMRLAISQRQDKVMDFREMGIDHIFIDESHCFKNLGFETRQDRVAGIGNSEGSQRAEKLLYAIRDIQDRKGTDLCATFLSGTIVTNSLTELYNVFNYLRPRALAAQNIHSFDAWSAVFCQKKTDYEPNVVGKIVSKERFAAYVNLPELSRFLSQVTDYRTSTMCGIDAPNAVQHFDATPPTPQQEEMLNNLVDFVSTGHWSSLNIQREAPANLDKALMLCATNIARQTALDPRMLDDCKTYGDEQGSKVRRCAENIYRIYQETNADKGTQFVFNDISTYDPSKWNMQSELREVLVNEFGIPSHEIVFISEATTNSTRLALFDKMNRGEVRVLIGSTTKLGTGVNAQERAVAVHHLDIPWRPSDMEQRNGRAVRKGNWLAKKRDNKVDVYIYGTERTLDAYKFSLLKNKQMFIDQLNKGTLGMRRIDESVMQDGDTAVSYAELLAIVSGDTSLLEKTRIDAKIMALEKDRQAFYRQRNEAVQHIEQHEKDIATLTEWIKYAKIDLQAHTDITEFTVPTIGGTATADMKEAGKALYNLIDTFRKEDFTEIGKCGSLTLSAIHHGDSNFFYIVGTTGQYYKCICKGNNTGILGKVGHEAVAHYPFETYSHIAKEIEQNEARIKHLQSLLPDLRSFSTKEWQGMDDLAELYTQQRALADKISGKQPA